MRRTSWLFPLLLTLLMGSGLLVARTLAVRDAAPPAGPGHLLKLWETPPPALRKGKAAAGMAKLKVIPGKLSEAEVYYKEILPNLVGFPKTALADSAIDDMLVYYGFPALPPAKLEALSPAVIMDFAQLRQAISSPEFDAAYRDHPLGAGEIVVARFFAPKIIDVSDPQQDGVPQKGGFGWRKVLRFKSRDGSRARYAGLDSFYLLFNFNSGAATAFPENQHAGQIQGLLTPTYPTGGRHRDAYFLVYEGLGSATPGKIGFYLNATFDLVKVVPDGKYYVPRACGQCHGTEAADQAEAKVNYLDTDHWIDRTGDDFKKVPADNVLVDHQVTYSAIRQLNGEIEKQNAAVIKPGKSPFALLAVRKWLELHQQGQPDADRHVPPLRRGFAEKAGDAVWTAGAAPDQELLPLLNQYCFRCHSSVRYHVFQKQAVIGRKASILARVKSNNMPQDRDFSLREYQDVKAKILQLVGELK